MIGRGRMRIVSIGLCWAILTALVDGPQRSSPRGNSCRLDITQSRQGNTLSRGTTQGDMAIWGPPAGPKRGWGPHA